MLDSRPSRKRAAGRPGTISETATPANGGSVRDPSEEKTMATTGKLTVTPQGDREVAITREFDAARSKCDASRWTLERAPWPWGP
jgi:hypothetical protein